MKKRLIALLLALSMTAVLAACGGGKDDAGAPEQEVTAPAEDVDGTVDQPQETPEGEEEISETQNADGSTTELDAAVPEEKPEHMTHLYGDVLVPKNHPRILLRGKMDTLESELILCQLADKSLEGPVGEILGLARQIIRCEVLGEPLKWDTLCFRRTATAQLFRLL